MKPEDSPEEWKLIKIEVSKNNKKKYDAYLENKKTKKIYIVSFGAKGMDQYFDKIGHYKNYNHLDNKRKKAYYARHGKDAKKYSAKYFSHTFLWS
jgi:hypothetical protein